MAVLWLALAGGATPRAAEGPPKAAPTLEVTTGTVSARPDGTFEVAVPELRAVLASGEGGGDAAELRFTYLGPTAARSRLASGQEREQLGLKLRAQDGCNLVYVMWRLAPRPGIAVSVKTNPGQRTHTQCGARGYADVRGDWSAAAPSVAPGSAHTLSARIEGDTLRVAADGLPAWSGTLPVQARALRGPAGVRSDNVAFEFTLRGLR